MQGHAQFRGRGRWRALSIPLVQPAQLKCRCDATVRSASRARSGANKEDVSSMPVAFAFGQFHSAPTGESKFGSPREHRLPRCFRYRPAERPLAFRPLPALLLQKRCRQRNLRRSPLAVSRPNNFGCSRRATRQGHNEMKKSATRHYQPPLTSLQECNQNE